MFLEADRKRKHALAAGKSLIPGSAASLAGFDLPFRNRHGVSMQTARIFYRFRHHEGRLLSGL